MITRVGCYFTKQVISNNCIYLSKQRLIKNTPILITCQNSIKSYNGIFEYYSIRFYSKSKDKKKDKGKKKIEVNETQLNEIFNMPSFKSQIEHPIHILKNDFIKNLSVRSAAGSIETLPVNYDGKDYTLQELAQVARKNANTIIINTATFPQAIPSILKAIEKSGMNLNPQQDGTLLYVPIPKLTTERRESMAKSAKVLFIKCRDNIRNVQNIFSKKIKQRNDLSEDDKYNIQQQITSLCDQSIVQAENIFRVKQNEIIGKFDK